MAIKLRYLTVIVRRAAFSHCRSLPAFLTELGPDGGILFDNCWYDAHLWCETVMSEFDAARAVADWRVRGLVTPERGSSVSADLCIAASGDGPLAPCEWLQFDHGDNCVWLSGAEKGPVFGLDARSKGER